jgi:thymidine phosphorylase
MTEETLTLKRVPLDTFRENTVLLARDCTVMRPERLAGSRKVEISYAGRSLLASPMVCDDPSVVTSDEIGVPEPLFHRLGAPPGAGIAIRPAAPAESLEAVRAKIAGETLSAAQFQAIAKDLAAHRWSDMEVAAFLVACASFMTTDETVSLTRAMIGAGRTLHWNRPLVVDKHCIGGVPGNRTSLVVVPIVAAHGLLIPKTSSRAITSPSGTADAMEVLCRVDLSEDEMRSVVERCGGCIVWGGRVNLSPADDTLISVERPLSIDTPEQMVASILSKKIAAGSTHLVLDVPVGPTVKIRDRRAALKLRKLFEHVAHQLGLGIDVLLTSAQEPIGRGVGPLLETQDALAVLKNEADAPADLREKAILLAGRVLEADPALGGGRGEARARELLESGAAAQRMDQIIQAQGASPLTARLGSLTYEARAEHDGHVAAIDCLRIAQIARLAGAPTDVGAGIALLRKTGEVVRRGEPVYRIHASESADFAFARECAEAGSGVVIAP